VLVRGRLFSVGRYTSAHSMGGTPAVATLRSRSASATLPITPARGAGLRTITLQVLMMGKLLSCAAPLAFLVSAAVAAPPADNVSGHRHPNLAAAQLLSTQAYEKIVAAQHANEFDMAGHAQKAKDLLDQVNRELKGSRRGSQRAPLTGGTCPVCGFVSEERCTQVLAPPFTCALGTARP